VGKEKFANLKTELRRDAYRPDGTWEHAKIMQLKEHHERLVGEVLEWKDLAEYLKEVEDEG